MAEQRLFPRCVVYLRLSCSSWALFKKLLKITNYPSLAEYITIPKPQRMPLVLTLSKTTHVTQHTSFFFILQFPSLAAFCLIWSRCYFCLLLNKGLSVITACPPYHRPTWRKGMALKDGRLKISVKNSGKTTWYKFGGLKYSESYKTNKNGCAVNEPLNVIIVLFWPMLFVLLFYMQLA